MMYIPRLNSSSQILRHGISTVLKRADDLKREEDGPGGAVKHTRDMIFTFTTVKGTNKKGQFFQHYNVRIWYVSIKIKLIPILYIKNYSKRTINLNANKTVY